VPELQHVGSGKVRELYDAGDDRLLLVASDRISAFDVIMPTPIPDKGRVLTGLSAFWFALTEPIVANHLVSLRAEDAGETEPGLRGRSMLVRRLRMLPVEFVVRGYLAGSGLKDYRATGAVSGVALPEGLRNADRLPEPIVTPARKATSGHDENISADEARALCGDGDAYDRAAAAALAVYERASQHARERGIVLADTKFEFGLDETGEVVLGDEVLTPDSSRFWPADAVVPGETPPSFDKQYLREWLEAQPWDKTPPGPVLPPEIAEGIASRYREAYALLAGRPFDRYLEEQHVV
jgi:phosphoribosylaminoimidazole-succinocarboxamide synthase